MNNKLTPLEKLVAFIGITGGLTILYLICDTIRFILNLAAAFHDVGNPFRLDDYVVLFWMIIADLLLFGVAYDVMRGGFRKQ